MSSQLSKHRILMLQGPVGPFFSGLQSKLEKDGHFVRRVIFNLADWAFSIRKGTLRFGREEHEWQNWLTETLEKHQIDTIILFGCERPHHSAARKIAAEQNLRVISLEEGYIRPGFLSVENHGNNRHSPMVKLLQNDFENLPLTSLPSPSPANGMGTVIIIAIFYYIVRALGKPIFRYQVHHRKRPLASEAFCWIRNMVRYYTRKIKNKRIIQNILHHHKDQYYIVPLQVSDDMQLLKASRGWNNENLISSVIRSFSQNTSEEKILIIKVHPFERGHKNYEAYVNSIALQYECENRIFLIDDGDLNELTSNSAGMITINSGSAYHAISNGIPIGVLGEALFKHPKLVNCLDFESDIDKFWQSPRTCTPKTSKHFIALLMANALVGGDYYCKKGRAEGIKNIADKVNGF